MGKIIETTYHDTVEKITGFNTSLINNSFYTFNDKKPTIVTYYNINKEASSLDPGSKISYDNIGEYSSLRFNKISDFMIYGFNRIELQTEMDEYGLEAEKISGDCYILPNTIIPTEGDYFQVEHIKDSTWLFIVTDVQQDTLLNGSNAYKLSYKLEYDSEDRISKNIVGNYKLIEKREGTNVAKIVEVTDLEYAKLLDKQAVMLKHYFVELFYNKYVQSFIYTDLTEWRVYDQFMTEFLIRNKILENGEDSYTFVGQEIPLPRTFTIDYDRSFFRVFEDKDVNKLLGSYRAIELDEINAFGTTFDSRYEPYFKAVYKVSDVQTGYRMECLPSDLVFRIMDNNLVSDVEDLNHKIPLWVNILIKHFSGERFTENEVNSIEEMNFDTSFAAFYNIPLLIYCLEDRIENILK
jgi:hypothetical protein